MPPCCCGVVVVSRTALQRVLLLLLYACSATETAPTGDPEADEEALLRNLPFKYIMTDFHPQFVAFWREHPSLKPLVELGLLDFAVFDLEKDKEMKLEVSGVTLSASSSKNPMVFIANYVYDTLTAVCVFI